MLNKLERLAKEIAQKNRELENLHKKHVYNTQGRTNGRPVYEELNKPSYTNANYMRNVNNAVRIVYRERRPLLERYNKAATKYRRLTGLPVMGLRGKPWQETVSFTRSKNTRRPNFIPLSTRRIYEYRNQYNIGTASGGGARRSSFTVHVHPYKFFPNVQLMNTLLRRIKATNAISKAAHQALSRPVFNVGNGTFNLSRRATRVNKSGKKVPVQFVGSRARKLLANFTKNSQRLV